MGKKKIVVCGTRSGNDGKKMRGKGLVGFHEFTMDFQRFYVFLEQNDFENFQRILSVFVMNG